MADATDFYSKLKALDVYPKTMDDLKERTLSGAAISLVCSVIVTILAVSEFRQLLRIDVTNTLGVDMRGEKNLAINVDIYFPSLPCNELVIDMTDVSGAQRLNVQNSLSKLRMNRDGVAIEVPQLMELGGSVAPAFKHRKVTTLMEDVTSKLEETEINMNTEEKNPQGTPEEREKHRQDIKDQVMIFGERLKGFVDNAEPTSEEEQAALAHGKQELEHVKAHVANTNLFNDAEKDFVLKNINAMHRNFERIANGTTDKVKNNLKEALRIRLSILSDNTKGFILNEDLERREKYDSVETALDDIIEHMHEMDFTPEEKIDLKGRIDTLHLHLDQLQDGAKGQSAVDLQETITKEMTSLLAEIKGEPMDMANYCGSCYGAGDEGVCCNTCDQVKAAYRKKRWGMPNEDALEQCRRAKKLKAIKYEEGEGCNIFGTVEVTKVSGHFMIAPGVSSKHCDGRGCHILHEFTHSDVSHFNITHKINRLSFGEDYPGRTNPLDSAWLHSPTGPGVAKYFLKVVPTTYKDMKGGTVVTNQFAVTEYFKAVDVEHNKFTMPGVFINYDFTPFEVKYHQTRGYTFLTFITRSAAVIGGVFTVAGIFDKLLYHSSKVIAKKMGEGKLS